MKIVLLFLIAVVTAVAAIAVAVASMTYLAVGIGVILIAVVLAFLLKLPPWVLIVLVVYTWALAYQRYSSQYKKKPSKRHSIDGGSRHAAEI